MCYTVQVCLVRGIPRETIPTRVRVDVDYWSPDGNRKELVNFEIFYDEFRASTTEENSGQDLVKYTMVLNFGSFNGLEQWRHLTLGKVFYLKISIAITILVVVVLVALWFVASLLLGPLSSGAVLKRHRRYVRVELPLAELSNIINDL
eukprot:GHVT01103687.1.p1 GENE.GHVT01103687.1~~GHVT01103687.1.p1  ORF type:complete len:148 (+),score=1.55 GHVT01103687.1:2068-2511(+)